MGPLYLNPTVISFNSFFFTEKVLARKNKYSKYSQTESTAQFKIRTLSDFYFIFCLILYVIQGYIHSFKNYTHMCNQNEQFFISSNHNLIFPFKYFLRYWQRLSPFNVTIMYVLFLHFGNEHVLVFPKEN